jgi:excisionase family DNA binding protein
MTSIYIDIHEAAKRYDLPVSWLYERTRTKSIPVRKFGKYLRFRVDELDDWFENSCSLKSQIDRKRKP